MQYGIDVEIPGKPVKIRDGLYLKYHSCIADSPGDQAALDAAGVQLAQPEVVRRVQGRLPLPVHPQALRRSAEGAGPLRRPKRQRVDAQDAQTQEGNTTLQL